MVHGTFSIDDIALSRWNLIGRIEGTFAFRPADVFDPGSDDALQSVEIESYRFLLAGEHEVEILDIHRQLLRELAETLLEHEDGLGECMVISADTPFGETMVEAISARYSHQGIENDRPIGNVSAYAVATDEANSEATAQA